MTSVRRVCLLAGVAILAAGPAFRPADAAPRLDAATVANGAGDSDIRLVGRRTPRNPQPPPSAGGASSTPAPSGAEGSTPALPSDLTTPGVTPLPILPTPTPLPPASTTLQDDKPRHTLANCMKLWDADTHMSKVEWRATCLRSLNEADKARSAEKPSGKKKKPRRKRNH